MNQPADLIAQDAAEALIALGWPVEPYGLDLAFWRIGDLVWTDDELMGLAAQQVIRVACHGQYYQ